MSCRDDNKLHMFVGVDGQCIHCGWRKPDLDRDAGHEEPWAGSYADLIAEAYKGSALEYWNAHKAQWGAERALYSRQLQDANKRIHELEQELLKLREELKALTSGQTVSVPLSAWNKMCAEAAKARPLAEEKPEAFPARALRFSA